MIVTERETGRDTGRGRSRLHALGARRGIRSRVSRIAPWAKGRRQTAAPPRDPGLPHSNPVVNFIFIVVNTSAGFKYCIPLSPVASSIPCVLVAFSLLNTAQSPLLLYPLHPASDNGVPTISPLLTPRSLPRAFHLFHGFK